MAMRDVILNDSVLQNNQYVYETSVLRWKALMITRYH